MKKLLTIIFAGTISFAGLCQQTVKGTITDSRGDSVVGAVVINEGLSATTTSDGDGKFEIRAHEGQVLLFSCLGLNDATVTVKNVDEYLNVVMSVDNVILQVPSLKSRQMTSGQDLLQILLSLSKVELPVSM